MEMSAIALTFDLFVSLPESLRVTLDLFGSLANDFGSDAIEIVSTKLLATSDESLVVSLCPAVEASN